MGINQRLSMDFDASKGKEKTQKARVLTLAVKGFIS